MKVSLPCKFDNADASVKALFDDPKLFGRRPAPPSLLARAVWARRRPILKLVVPQEVRWRASGNKTANTYIIEIAL
jgi:hypothetical protein